MIVSVLNVKGGCGKSTVAINLATGFAYRDYETLLIDTDEEGTALAWSSRRERPTKRLTVVALPEPKALKNSIGGLVEKHDLIVIDGAPHLREMLTITLALSSLVIIPVVPSPNDLWKLGPLVERIHEIEGMRGKKVNACFLVNNYVARTRLSEEVTSALSSYDLPVLEARLTTRMDYRDSLAQGTAAIEFTNPKAKSEIIALLDEVHRRLGLDDQKDLDQTTLNAAI